MKTKEITIKVPAHVHPDSVVWAVAKEEFHTINATETLTEIYAERVELFEANEFAGITQRELVEGAKCEIDQWVGHKYTRSEMLRAAAFLLEALETAEDKED